MQSITVTCTYELPSGGEAERMPKAEDIRVHGCNGPGANTGGGGCDETPSVPKVGSILGCQDVHGGGAGAGAGE